MYNTIKKLSLSFIFLNLFMLQSLKADMMFYYSAAILPSIIAQGQASPTCPPKVVLNDVDGVYNAIIDNLSFVEEDGRRTFEAELDTSRYVIDGDFYTAVTPITTMNPMYFMYYEDVNTTYETRAEFEIDQVNIETNNTWGYDSIFVENDNGIKTYEMEAEDGNWSTESDGSTTLSIGGEPVVNIKPVRAITKNQMKTILSNAGIDINLTSGDNGQLNIDQEFEDWYWWDQAYSQETFETLGDAVAAAKYNSDNTFAYIALWGDRGAEGVGITFAADSTGTSGTLVEVTNDNKLLSANAGTWEIIEIDDDGDIYDVIAVHPTLCGYNTRALAKLDDIGRIIQGEHSDVAGELLGSITFSESLKDKLKAYFVENAILDVDPDTALALSYSYEELASSTVYVVNEDLAKKFVITYAELGINERNITVDSFDQINQIQQTFTLDQNVITLGSGTTITRIAKYADYSHVLVDLDGDGPGEAILRRSYSDRTLAEAFITAGLSYSYEELASQTVYGVKEDGSFHFVLTYAALGTNTRYFTPNSFDQTNQVLQTFTIDQNVITLGDGTTITRIAKHADYSYVLVDLDGDGSGEADLRRAYSDRALAEAFLLASTMAFSYEEVASNSYYGVREDGFFHFVLTYAALGTNIRYFTSNSFDQTYQDTQPFTIDRNVILLDTGVTITRIAKYADYSHVLVDLDGDGPGIADLRRLYYDRTLAEAFYDSFFP